MPSYRVAVDPEDPSDGDIPPSRMVGILCTYRRPAEAVLAVERLAGQTRRPDLVVVVDNASDTALRSKLTEVAAATGVPLRYVDPGANVGPAGAFSLAFDLIGDTFRDGDLVLHLDDDDPPVDPEQLGALERALHDAIRRDPSVAGIGLSGGRLRERTGLIAPVEGRAELEDVDHLHGGYLPLYRAGALREVGGCDASFFYGFEELELGRRLHLRGHRLLVHNDLMRGLVHLYPKRGRRAMTTTVDEDDLGWSRFHKERNLIRILRRERRWTAVAFTVVVRHLAKPVVAMVRSPRLGWRRLRLGAQAVVAGLQETGGIDPRHPPP